MTAAARPLVDEPWSSWRLNGLVATTNAHRPGALNLAFLHEALGSSAPLLSLAPLIADCNLAFIDLRGHGRSHKPAEGYAVDVLARETAVPLRHAFGGQGFALVAESVAGVIGLAIGAHLPELSHVFLIDTPFDTTRMPLSQRAALCAHEQALPADRPAIEALCREVLGLDLASGRMTARRYHAYLSERWTPATVITGTRKATAGGDGGEPAACFDATDVAAAGACLDRPPLGIVEIAGGGHRLLRTHPASAIAVIRRVLGAAA